jgi:hypothetical protein
VSDRLELPRPWGVLPLGAGDEHQMELGTLHLTLRRSERELWVRLHRAADGDPEGSEWSRWAVPTDGLVELRPAVPDRLLVVSHEHAYHLPPRGESRVFVRIPLFVRVVVVRSDGEDVVADAPSVVLSDTWWGTFVEGELAYWLTTKARVQLDQSLFLHHFGMCALRLTNQSEVALPVERFAVRVAHLTLFSDGSRNWTDEVHVRYEDSPEGSAIRFSRKPPAEAGDVQRLARPRVPLERGFHAKTFDRLRSLSNLGL